MLNISALPEFFDNYAKNCLSFNLQLYRQPIARHYFLFCVLFFIFVLVTFAGIYFIPNTLKLKLILLCYSLIMRGCRLNNFASLFKMAFFGLSQPLIRKSASRISYAFNLLFCHVDCLSCNKKTCYRRIVFSFV